MRKTTLIALCLSVAAVAATASAAQPQAAADTLTASDALVAMPAKTLDLLSTGMRQDIIEYFKADSIHHVPNAMDGLSYLVPPLTDDYLQVQVTPVTRFTLRMLPGRKGRVVATSYTVGDSLQAPDSELQFFDADMETLRLDKIIKMATVKDFLKLDGVDRKTRDELMALIPFPTVEYSFSPDGTDLTARLTVGEFLGKEVNDKLAPYLRRERVYRWDGSGYKLVTSD